MSVKGEEKGEYWRGGCWQTVRQQAGRQAYTPPPCLLPALLPMLPHTQAWLGENVTSPRRRAAHAPCRGPCGCGRASIGGRPPGSATRRGWRTGGCGRGSPRHAAAVLSCRVSWHWHTPGQGVRARQGQGQAAASLRCLQATRAAPPHTAVLCLRRNIIIACQAPTLLYITLPYLLRSGTH